METKMRVRTSIALACGCLLSATAIASLLGQAADEGRPAAPGGTARPGCTVTELSALNIPNLTVTSATEVPASASDPGHCDVIGTVATQGEGARPGAVTFRARLPATWNN